MRPLGGVALGLGIVLLDVNVEVRSHAFDVVPDVLGWVVVASFLRPLRERHRLVPVAQGLSVVLALLSLLAIAAPDFADVWVGLPAGLAEAAFVVLLCTALIGMASQTDQRAVTQLELVRAAEVILTLVVTPLVLTDSSGDAAVVLLAIAGLGVRVWLLALLVSRQDRPYAAGLAPA